MKTHEPFESDELLEEQAAVWLIECGEGFPPPRAASFAEWCKFDPRHAAAVARVEKSLALLDQMPAIRVPLEASLASNSKSKRSKLRSRTPGHLVPWRWTAGLAAALIFGVLIWRLVPTTESSLENYAADTITAKRVGLSDGSVVDLNSNSQLQVRFLAEKRQLTLASGEAHFQVAHDAAHPFVVTAHGISVRAVGTAFNVRLDGEKVDVIVTEGRVTIERLQDASSSAAALLPILAAGERTQITAAFVSAPQIEKIAPEAVRTLLSWQDRMMTFTNTPLREMVARINRCNMTQLVLGDVELGDRKIGGVIDLSQVEAFVHLLEQDGDIVAERRSGEEIVLRHAH